MRTYTPSSISFSDLRSMGYVDSLELGSFCLPLRHLSFQSPLPFPPSLSHRQPSYEYPPPPELRSPLPPPPLSLSLRFQRALCYRIQYRPRVRYAISALVAFPTLAVDILQSRNSVFGASGTTYISNVSVGTQTQVVACIYAYPTDRRACCSSWS